MKTTIVIAFASLLSLSVPAFAQDAGQPGATGTGHGLTGSNTGTGGSTLMSGHSKHGRNGYVRHYRRHMMRHHYRHHMM